MTKIRQNLPRNIILQISKHFTNWLPLRLVSIDWKEAIRERISTVEKIKEICQYQILPTNFIEENYEYLPSYELSKYQQLSHKLIHLLLPHVNPEIIFLYQENVCFTEIAWYLHHIDPMKRYHFFRSLICHRTSFPTWFLEEWISIINRHDFYKIPYQQENLDFVLKNQSLIMNWNSICKQIALPYEFLEEKIHLIGRPDIFLAKGVNWYFITKHATSDDWVNLLTLKRIPLGLILSQTDLADLPSNHKIWEKLSNQSQYLDTSFINYFSHNLDWNALSKFAKLDETIIEENSNLVNWNLISIFQTLSNKFINRYFEQLDHIALIQNQKLDRSTIYRIWTDTKISELYRNEIIKYQMFDLKVLDMMISLLNKSHLIILLSRADIGYQTKNKVRELLGFPNNEIVS